MQYINELGCAMCLGQRMEYLPFRKQWSCGYFETIVTIHVSCVRFNFWLHFLSNCLIICIVGDSSYWWSTWNFDTGAEHPDGVQAPAKPGSGQTILVRDHATQLKISVYLSAKQIKINLCKFYKRKSTIWCRYIGSGWQ